MKLNRLLLMSVMGLGLFACNNNDLVEGTSGQDGTQSEGTTYVGFTLKFNDANTRTTKTETGTGAEQNINSVYVLVADGDNVITIGSLSATPDNTIISGTTKVVFATKPGKHDFYVVVNPDQVPSNETGGNAETISEYFNSSVALDPDNIAKTTDDVGNFMMSSLQATECILTDNITEEQAAEGLKDDAATNNFTLQVERVTAKITMTCASDILKDATTDENSAEELGKILNTDTEYPVFNVRGMASHSHRMAQATIAEVVNNTWTGKKLSTKLLIGETYSNATPVYCLENLHTTKTYKQGNVTYVTLKTTFIPKQVLDLTANNETLKDYDGYTASTKASFYVVRSGSNNVVGRYILANELDSFREDDPNKLPTGVTSIEGPYTDGECWFGPIWIGQTDTNIQDAPVNRNTWYNLSIAGLKLPGEPEEPEIDPEQPLVPDTYVAITLDVMPWNFIDREIDLQ